MGNAAVPECKEEIVIEPVAHNSRFNPLDHPISFAYPARIANSGWIGHVPFGMYLIDALRPNAIAELGTHHGVSYCAFCQAVKKLGLETRCYAIDSWEGDAHSGLYGSEVLTDLEEYHNPLYGGFSRLIQSSFDEALGHFADHTLDLLHIDGFHTYDVVKRDFEKWLPKLTDRGVVLLHDINVRERGFGVWKVWEELRLRFPHFEFVHSHGLGVLAVGKHYPEELNQLFQCSAEEATRIRGFFASVGARLELTQELETLKRSSQEQLEAAIAPQENLKDQVRRAEEEIVSQRTAYEAELARQVEELSEVRLRYEREITRQRDELNGVRAGYERQITWQTDELNEVRAGYEAQIEYQSAEFYRQVNELSAASSVSPREDHQAAENESLRARLVESEKIIRARDEALALLQIESAESGEKNWLLAAQLLSKTREVEQVTGSFGWRLLSQYGRLKHRYLLPLYRMLGLPSSSTVSGDGPASQSQIEHQSTSMAQPRIIQGSHVSRETLAPATGRDETRVALESSSCDGL
jgi:hypothetical protein